MSKPVTVSKIYEELAHWQQIRDMLAREHGQIDPATLVDTLDGATHLVEAICAVDCELVELEAQLSGIETVITRCEKRRDRVKKSIETLKSIILMAMTNADELDSVRHPLGTISCKRIPGALVVDHEIDIPARYWRQPDPVVDKKVLRAALTDDPTIPGAHIEPDGTTLQIRRS